ncbi:sulfatase-like hydrolase/transferase [Halorussus aquaticus]|uniref:Sulfatase-like hydrolase/transferase n=1 Tax=Halorussus aquaticus TaxID=2953748 RepID=A0ABD5Q5W3_9EURY|nr:sulfatase-like hydrolase/transferase [Halorussus aquaticus]
MTHPNVLLLVWDSARLDYAAEHAPNLSSLAERNLFFKNAVAPATWSLPSHVSLFTGEYPHEHGVHRFNHTVSRLPLVEHLKRDGYDCYGVSGNGFASPRIGFDVSFDEFYDTRNSLLYDSGLSVRYVAKSLQEEGNSLPMVAAKTLYRALGHDKPYKSLRNFLNVATSHLGSNYEFLQQLPVSGFKQSTSYDSESNTARITNVIESHSEADDPFFIFANYMDCHRPYDPPSDLQRKHVGEVVDDDELTRLDEEVADPWQFVERVEGGDGIDEEDLRTIRRLYAGEVESVDRHLGRILSALESNGLRENTLVVITADHAENLGNVDAMGRRRIGHEGSVSDDLVRVPLVIGHPDLDGECVEEYVSIKDLCGLLTDGRGELLRSGGDRYGPLSPSDGVVLSEYPVVGGEELYEKYPDVPTESLADRVSEHSVVAYRGDWRVVLDSTGEEWAWHRGDERPLSDAPSTAVDACRDALAELQGNVSEDELSDEEIEQLEALGYM